MNVQITIRNVPAKVRDELAARAALQGKSMQEYLREELERRLAARPPIEEVLARIRQRKRAAAGGIFHASYSAAPIATGGHSGQWISARR